MYVLSADVHLSEVSSDDYRWGWFDQLRLIDAQYPSISHVFVLGDFVDKRDRFSAAFVNRLLGEIKDLPPMTILRGNHDTTLRPPAYFEFLSNYISKPTEFTNSLLLLPFSASPKEEWRGLNLSNYRAVFMHATVTGAVIDHGIVLENRNFPVLPRSVKFYSGDIHHPQVVGPVTYVGAPHPIRFGDDFLYRMLLIDETTYDIVQEIILSPPRKLLLDIRNVTDLARVKVLPGDQVRVRFSCTPGAIGKVEEIQSQISNWAQSNGVRSLGVETVINTSYNNNNVDTLQTPQAILEQFAASRGLSEEVTAMGLALLREVS